MQVVRARDKYVPLLIEMMHELALSGVGRRDQTDSVLESQLREVLADPGWVALILRDNDGTPVGYCIIRIISSVQYRGEKVALIHDFLIRRPFRRRGYGRRFYGYIYNEYLNGKVSRIFMTVPGRNERALGFWEAMGFEIEGVRMKAQPEKVPGGTPDPDAEPDAQSDRPPP